MFLLDLSTPECRSWCGAWMREEQLIPFSHCNRVWLINKYQTRELLFKHLRSLFLCYLSLEYLVYLYHQEVSILICLSKLSTPFPSLFQCLFCQKCVSFHEGKLGNLSSRENFLSVWTKTELHSSVRFSYTKLPWRIIREKYSANPVFHT